MYSLHLTHVGEKASVNNTSSVTHAALFYYMAGGGCTQDLRLIYDPRGLILPRGRWWLCMGLGSVYGSHVVHIGGEVSRSIPALCAWRLLAMPLARLV